jgi:hypothetical protein
MMTTRLARAGDSASRRVTEHPLLGYKYGYALVSQRLDVVDSGAFDGFAMRLPTAPGSVMAVNLARRKMGTLGILEIPGRPAMMVLGERFGRRE